MSNNSHPELIVKQDKGLSAVWLVPIIALLFGAWLVVKAVSERGVFITVQFDNANGIVVGKTEVRYKGLTVGKVSDIDVTEDLQSVLVEIEMIAEAKQGLTEHTQFWYVTADVSFAGVKGLDTLLSGSYINIQPDTSNDGEPQRFFVALKEEPPLDKSEAGLHLSLTTKELGSITKDSAVTYRQIKVGYVSNYRFDEQLGLVTVNIFIEPEHANLVTDHARFWNASGFSMTGSLTSGVHIQAESLASIVTGGIAFDNSDVNDAMSQQTTKTTFPLHRNFLDASMGHRIELELAWDADIDIGAAIVYQGVTLGRIESFTNIDPNTRKIIAQAKVNPRVKPYLTTESQFYLISPEFNLGGATNMHRFLTGAQIGIRPSIEGEQSAAFKVYSKKPAYKYTEPGLHLVLETDSVSSLDMGDGIYYKQQKVGSVQAVENVGQNKFLVHIFIEPSFQGYVNHNSRFWNASGMRLTGNLQDFELQLHSVQSVLQGGIAFDKGDDDAKQPDNGDTFTLHANETIAKQRYLFDLVAPSSKVIKKGMRIIHRGEQAGAIHEVQRRDGNAYIRAGLLPEFAHLLKQNSQFWLVKPQVSLSGLSDTDAIFGGAYIAVNAGDGEATNRFMVSTKPPAKPVSFEGLQLTLQVKEGNVVNVGSPVSYRGITVGQVDNVTFKDAGKNVALNISIDEEHRSLITSATRFYNASGITLAGSISNFIVDAESVDTMLTGGISFYNPQTSHDVSDVAEGTHFTLFNNIKQAQSAGTLIRIAFNDVNGLHQNMAIKYKDQQVGFVERVIFDQQALTASVEAYLNDAGAMFAVSGAKYWLAIPKLGLIGNQNLGDILSGGFIGVLPSDEVNAGQQTSFSAHDMPPAVKQLPYGLNLTLVAERLGSVRVGNPVLYRQIPVGTVIGVDLASSADKVHVYINIAQRYASLVTSASQFWNTSGVTVDAGLFSGVQIDSESLETLIAGGIAFATPESASEQVSQGMQFILAPEVNKDWQQWSPKIQLGGH